MQLEYHIFTVFKVIREMVDFELHHAKKILNLKMFFSMKLNSFLEKLFQDFMNQDRRSLGFEMMFRTALIYRLLLRRNLQPAPQFLGAPLTFLRARPHSNGPQAASQAERQKMSSFREVGGRNFFLL